MKTTNETDRAAWIASGLEIPTEIWVTLTPEERNEAARVAWIASGLEIPTEIWDTLTPEEIEVWACARRAYGDGGLD